MTLEQLRVFVAVAERRHVTRAAKDLGITQSSASAAVAALEARYGAKLFDRVGREIHLTETGRYARVGGIIGYTIFLVSVAIAVLIDLLSALGI